MYICCLLILWLLNMWATVAVKCPSLNHIPASEMIGWPWLDCLSSRVCSIIVDVSINNIPPLFFSIFKIEILQLRSVPMAVRVWCSFCNHLISVQVVALHKRTDSLAAWIYVNLLSDTTSSSIQLLHRLEINCTDCSIY